MRSFYAVLSLTTVLLLSSCDQINSIFGSLSTTYQLTLSASTGGTIQPSGTVKVKGGSAVVIQATPLSGYTFDGWVVQSGTALLSNPQSASTTVTLNSGSAAVTAQFSSSGGSVPTGYIAYYTFDGNANDSSGNGYDGTVYNAALTTDRFGTSNAAYAFNGTDAYIQTIPAASIPSSITVGAWLYPTSLSKQIWGSINNPSGGKNGFANFIGADGSLSFIRYYANNGSSYITSSAGAVAVNQWSHVVFTFDDSTGAVGIYVNGVEVGSGTCSILSNANDIPLTFGISLLLQTQYFYAGAIDDVRVYNRALTSAEVQTLYANGG